MQCDEERRSIYVHYLPESMNRAGNNHCALCGEVLDFPKIFTTQEGGLQRLNRPYRPCTEQAATLEMAETRH